MNPYSLPRSLPVAGQEHSIHADFREVLQILGYLGDETLPEYLRWHVALGLFYDEVPLDVTAAAQALSEFLRCGEPETPGHKLLDWQQDAVMILADVNRAAGLEVRSQPFVHWWTFLGYFHAIGPGQLSTVVGIRQKLRRGQKLEDWEQQFYRENRGRVDLKRPETAADAAEKQRLLKLLGEEN